MRIAGLLRQPAFLIALFVTALVWGADRAGWLQRPSLWAYDVLVAHPLWVSTPAPRVVLLEVADGDMVNWPRLVERLQELGAAQIVFSELPNAPRLLQTAQGNAAIVFGRRVLAIPQDGAPALAPLPAAGGTVLTGISTAAPAADGVYRQQRLFQSIAGSPPLPHLEIVAARLQLRDRFAQPDGNAYLVNFLDGHDGLPRLHPDELAAPTAFARIRNRTVVIGAPARTVEDGLMTPLPGPSLSLAAFQAFALDSLLRDRVIEPLPGLVDLALLLMAALVAAAAYQRLSFTRALQVCTGLVIAFVLITGIVLVQAYRLLPVVDFALLQTALLLAVFAERRLAEEQVLAAVHARLRSRLQALPDVALQSANQDPWRNVIAMVTQVLDLRRLIFLECRQGEARLREVAALNCAFSDIREQRRDPRRAPYAAALAAKRPLRLDERGFLWDAANGEEEQFLVVLSFAGEVQGFWALAVDAACRRDTPDFTATVDLLAQQIGELLFHQRRKPAPPAMGKGWAAWLWRWVAAPPPLQEPREALLLLDRRLDLLQELVQQLQDPVAVYDVYGQLLYHNRAMAHWSRQAALPIATLDAFQLMSRLLQDPGRTRRLLRHAAVARGHLVANFEMPGTERSCELRLRPVDMRPGTAPASGAPFDLHGVLLHIRDPDGPELPAREEAEPVPPMPRASDLAASEVPARSVPALLPFRPS